MEGSQCSFPFRYKGRLYDSCVTLSVGGREEGHSEDAWCSTETDSDMNHVEGSEQVCDAACYATNCPLGYYSAYPDNTCIKVSVSHPDTTVPDFESAHARCAEEGARLFQPKNFFSVRTLESADGEFLDDGPASSLFPFAGSGGSAVAVGLTVKFQDGAAVPRFYPSGPDMPQNTRWLLNWEDGYPEIDPDKTCVAYVGGKLRNVPCDGYYDGREQKARFFEPFLK